MDLLMKKLPENIKVKALEDSWVDLVYIASQN